MQVTFVAKPDALPPPPAAGRVALFDVAFAAGDAFAKVTQPFLASLGDRLTLWVDHHDHPACSTLKNDARFVLTEKRQARACPQLVTPEIAANAGRVDHVLAHADFDGCMAAAKFLRGGTVPYPEADEDARFADAPGQGFACSARGERYVNALDYLEGIRDTAGRLALLNELVQALVRGEDGADLGQRLTDLSEKLRQHQAELTAIAATAKWMHPQVLLVCHDKLESAEKKFILRLLEEKARVGVVYADGWSGVATFDDQHLDLRELPGVTGMRGYVWGQVAPESLLAALSALLARS